MHCLKAQSEIKQALEEIADTPKLPNEFEQERLSLNKQIIATEEKIKSLQEQMKQSFDLILFKKSMAVGLGFTKFERA